MTTTVLEIDQAGTIYGGAYYMNGPFCVFSIKERKEKIDWTLQLGNS